MIYKILISGHFDDYWENYFEGFTFQKQIKLDGTPMTEMVGVLVDQSAMYGLINRFRNFGIELISITPFKNENL